MLIFTKILDLQAFLGTQRTQARTVGFVPTMGALHPGHMSLIARSRRENGVTVCSIFVNPTQFNDRADLERYPRTPENDRQMLETAGCDALFMPATAEMYPDGTADDGDLGELTRILEGAHRPGHFKGVAQIVKKLFDAVEPDRAYFGRKDFQQVMVIRELVKRTGSKVEVIACPIVREVDGLAMSSRNTLLSAAERKTASNVPKILARACALAEMEGIENAKAFVNKAIANEPSMRLDYFEICDTTSLAPLREIHEVRNAVALIAVYVGKIRLIDNMLLSEQDAVSG